MRVKKRDGNFEEVSFDKVINRLRSLCEMKPELHYIDVTEIAQKVCSRIYDGVSTKELDELGFKKSKFGSELAGFFKNFSSAITTSSI